MKLFITVSAMICLVAGTAIGADWVDIGNPASEGTHNIQGWGPIEPATSTGSYGGIDDCRCTWFDNGDPNNPDPRWATVDMNFGAGGPDVCLILHHLEGLADDSFDVHIGTTWVYSHADIISNQELWIWTVIPISGFTGVQTVTLTATGTQWGSFSIYGQMAFDEIGVGNCAVPSDEITWGSVKSLYR